MTDAMKLKELESAYGHASSAWCRAQRDMIQAYDEKHSLQDQEKARIAYVESYRIWVLAHKALKQS